MAVQRLTSRDIRSESRLDVMTALVVAREASRNDLTRQTGLSSATVATVVAELIAAGIITEGRTTTGKVGRPTTVLHINAERGYVVGVDVAETYVRAIVFDAALDEVGSAQVARDEHESTAEYVADGVERAVVGALEDAGVSRDRVLGVGVSLPGLVVRESTTSILVPEWTWHESGMSRVRDHLGLPMVIENPLKAVAAAELWFGEGRESGSFVTLNLGTGVGAGIVIAGEILRGATSSAGEWGHSLLVLDGRGCRCGRRGCVEAYVGAPGIQETLREVDPEHPLAHADLQQHFIEALAASLAADSADPAVVETIRRTSYYLGSAIADLVAIINPEVVTLTGWTAWALGDYLVPLTRDVLVAQAPGESAVDVHLHVSTGRGNLVATGMAVQAMTRFLVDVGLLTSKVPAGL
ncbi:putative NBD/HSP70 family sugar kinase [Salana multivorans]|uniref:Putative NBD/HSP70 family sugar kinase n=1 Tax=Salana multivorans TaxID=120377 RepID=A0A3N2DCQ9_9MICO|nr:ROK family protein [Salana multivorans]ROR97224.1 putative NBD/HSP70 family sugar kinase [Salana multivorans]